MKCEGSSCLPDIYASHLFLVVPPRDEWTDSGAVCPHPCPPPACAGSAVRRDERRGGGPELGTRAGALSMPLLNSTGPLFPVLGRALPWGAHTHALTYTHTYTHTHGMDRFVAFLLSWAFRRAAQDWLALLHGVYCSA